MNRTVALRDFGFNFLGPICSEYLHALEQLCQSESPRKLVFLAREGYFLEQVYQHLVSKGLMSSYPAAYLNVSRTFLFRISIADPYTWQWSLYHKYKGTLADLLVGRFGFTLSQLASLFTEEELAVNYELPAQGGDLELVLSQHLPALKSMVQESRNAYLDYLQSLGIGTTDTPLMIDVGYSGTIQKMLTRLLQCESQGLYFITTEDGLHDIEGFQASISSVFKTGVRMGDGYLMLDRSLFLESLLTAPNGQFVEIGRMSELTEPKFHFFYGRQTRTQSHFQDLQVVFAGAQQAIEHFFRHRIRFSTEEIECMYQQYVTKRNLLPRAVCPLFDVDDVISGNGNVNPLQLFGV
ncbi:HAD family hydrolase [Bowmanella sp. Y26]|uniref:HAD family hydrolase n=1 Tax=Bowmanella yangjiangensis TaxID=2811230 RepID=UPI001BDCA85A|nr:HAD family hydrolase [Bowmanella yangjiangensis]MBT1064910.1 HAD family hydrolase [Bowmanella yangjiangensis]